MQDNMITFRQATTADSLLLSRGLHAALLINDVTDERLRRFADLVCSRHDVLYSPQNTTVAMADGNEAGIITAYDGSRYAAMRQVTMPLLKREFDIEFPEMEDETEAGEYYLDSLAVMPEFRNRGIGRALLTHAIAEGKRLGLAVTLAVDPDNTGAQRLYHSLGFRHMRDIFIFGHTYWKWRV